MRKREDMDNDDLRRMEEKRKKREARYQKQDAHREKRAAVEARNVIGLAGFILSCCALATSAIGGPLINNISVIAACVALAWCIIGCSKKRPYGFRKTLAAIGLAVSLISIINAVRYSNNFTVDDDSMSMYSTELSTDEGEGLNE